MLRKIIILLLLSSCGKNIFHKDHIHNPSKDPRKNAISDPAFDDYIASFEFDYDREIGDIPINFNDLKDQKAGVCYTWSSGHAEIEIDRSYWDTATENEKTAIIYHELGHCELGRGHFDAIRKDGCALSIMNWIVIRDKCMDKHFDDYIEEMFR